jgi:hypothetical protein
MVPLLMDVVRLIAAMYTAHSVATSSSAEAVLRAQCDL